MSVSIASGTGCALPVSNWWNDSPNEVWAMTSWTRGESSR